MSASKFNPFATEVEVVVVDDQGKPTGETRTFANPSFAHLWPDEPMILIDWGFGKEKGYRVDEDVINRSIKYGDLIYHGNWAWGSAVKRMFTIGLVNDLVLELGKKAEDGQRFGRYATPNALYGAGIGTLKVMAIPAGTTFNGLQVEDGFGYITRERADSIYNNRNKIQLRDARDSFHFWQRVPWTAAVEAESVPILEDHLIMMSNPTNWHLQGNAGIEEKQSLVDIDPIMAQHAFVANAMSRTSSDMGIRLATTVPTHSRTKLAVPTTDKSLNVNGPYIVTGYPIDAWGSMKAFDVQDADQTEIDRIAAMEAVQYSLSSHGVFAKGNLGIVDDLSGYDMIICDADVKMGKLTAEALKDVYLGFTSYWGAGSCMGIEAKVWKLMGRDFDGDTMQLTNCATRPALWAAVKGLPEQDTLKLDKTNNPMNTRSEMIVKSMTSIVGFATNVAATSFVYNDRAFLAQQLGYKEEIKLDNQLNYSIKVGTDGFKAKVDMAKAEMQCAVLQSNMIKLTGCSAPWTGWSNDGWSFKHGVPAWLTGAETKEDRKNPAVKAGIPADFDGTIAQILKITLPNMDAFMDVAISSRPLSEFVNWVGSISDELYHEAEKQQVAFNTRVQAVNWSDPEDVELFKKWWIKTLAKWMKHDNLTEEQAGSAMWRVAHSSRSTYAGAASVFYGFWDFCKKIIATKPGLSEAKGGGGIKTVIFGLNPDVERAISKCKVIEFEEAKGNARLIRKALVLDDASLMLGAQANVAPEKSGVDKGEYTAYITKRSDKSWFVTLTA